MKYVDIHAHIFNADIPVVAGARYSPHQSALVESYISHLDHYGFDYGVLIQPSFLGYDNSQMLQAIAAYASDSKESLWCPPIVLWLLYKVLKLKAL